MKRLGRVQALWRHPVKSMRGEQISAAPVRWAGLAGDRRYAFVRAGDVTSFPWLTGRLHAELLRYRPLFVDPSTPNASAVRVTSPEGVERAVEDPQLAEEIAQRFGGAVQLLHSSRGLHDSAPVSLIGAPTIDALCRAQSVPPEMRRFRNNLVVLGEQGAPFEEEAWLGQELQLGERDDSPRLHVDRRNERCVMINIEPDTLQPTHGLLRALAQERQACAGIYASVTRPGVVQDGDALFAVGG